MVVIANIVKANRYNGRRPKVSDARPKSGLNDVDVSMKAVESHDAAFEELKYEVITGCADAIRVLSNMATKYWRRMLPKINQNLVFDMLPMKSDVFADGDSWTILGPGSSTADFATASTTLLCSVMASAVPCSWIFANKGVLSFGREPCSGLLLLDGAVMVREEVESEAGEEMREQAWCKQYMEQVMILAAVNNISILSD